MKRRYYVMTREGERGAHVIGAFTEASARQFAEFNGLAIDGESWRAEQRAIAYAQGRYGPTRRQRLIA